MLKATSRLQKTLAIIRSSFQLPLVSYTSDFEAATKHLLSLDFPRSYVSIQMGF